MLDSMQKLDKRMDFLEQRVRRQEVQAGMEVRAEVPHGFTFPLDSKEDLERLDRVLADKTTCKAVVSVHDGLKFTHYLK